jgi:type I restriction enzyme R subunit
MTPAYTPEQEARIEIDRQLEAAGWQVQDYQRMNLHAQRGVAVREFPLKTGFADYLLCADGKAIGAVEAKKAGTTLSGVHHQSQKYSLGLPDLPPAWRKPLPFLYESTGVETYFTNGLDSDPRSQRVFTFHRPETLAGWAGQPDTLRGRLRHLPPLMTEGLWPPQIEAITHLEQSLAADRPRALIQMATGSGKTFTAVTAAYRLIKFGGARRVLFLVDRGNLGRQALREFQGYVTPDDGRKFSELYNVQHLTTNYFDDVSRVCITTIQRLYSVLKGEEGLDSDLEEPSMDELEGVFGVEPKVVVYNPRLPIEYFDAIFIDECHRSIYNLWRQVVEYFDAYLTGLTATPSKQTFGFFNQNLVMEYSRQRAVADGINVDGSVYRIRTRISEEGSSIQSGHVVEKRDRLTRAQRWGRLDEDLVYSANQLDTDVVAESQIRTIIRTFRDRLFTEIFPGRHEVPKTIIFAKDDSHAEDIVRIVREEFGRGNEFCQKITYKVSGVKTDDLIAEFRNHYYPRIAVTVDMIATGTDIKPVEALLFMRLVKSPNLFEQMLGRGTRVIHPTDLQAVTPDARVKERFVIVDAVGVVEHPKVDVQSLERNPSLSFDKLLDRLALGAADEDTLSTLAGRLARLQRKVTPQDEYAIAAGGGGQTLQQLANTLLDALDPDRHYAAAQAETGSETPSPAQIQQAAGRLMAEAARIFAANPDLRQSLKEIHQRSEQIIDSISLDAVREAGFSQDATAQARGTVDSFRQFIQEHQDEITALQLIFSQPQPQQRLTLAHVRVLAEEILRYKPAWTTEALWSAYTQLERDKVRGAGGQRVLTDLISLVRCVVQLEDELVPYPHRVQGRYQEWLAAQAAAGRSFTPEQRRWLDKIAEAVGLNLAFTQEDFQDYFFDEGGLLAARRLFGQELPALLDELNEVLVV